MTSVAGMLVCALTLGHLAPEEPATILGIRVGMSLVDVRAKLDPIGKADEVTPRSGGAKVAWAFTNTDFSSIAVRADENGKVKWITGFLKPGREKPFESLGELKKAQRAEDLCIWNVSDPAGSYRFVAKGKDDKAHTLTMILLPGPKL